MNISTSTSYKALIYNIYQQAMRLSIITLLLFSIAFSIRAQDEPTQKTYLSMRIGGSAGIGDYGHYGPYNGDFGNAAGGFNFDLAGGYYVYKYFGVGVQFNTYTHKNINSTINTFNFFSNNNLVERWGDWTGHNIAISPRVTVEFNRFRVALYGLVGMLTSTTAGFEYERTTNDTYEQILIEKQKISGASGGFGIEFNYMLNEHLSLNSSAYGITSPQSYSMVETRTYTNTSGTSITTTVHRIDQTITSFNYQFGVGLAF